MPARSVRGRVSERSAGWTEAPHPDSGGSRPVPLSGWARDAGGRPFGCAPRPVLAEMGSDLTFGLDAWNTEMAGDGDGEARIR